MFDKITVVGGSGFIGTELIDLLSKNHKIINVDKRPSEKHNNITKIADVRNIDSLRTTIDPDSDIIIVLAAEHADNVSPISLYYDVNVEGARNILEVCEEKNIKHVFFTSTAAVYGLANYTPNENSPTNPFNHYGKSKLQAEGVYKEWYLKDTDQRSLIIIRPTVVFGPGNKGNVYNLLHQISIGKFLMIGSGENRKSMAYVLNVCSFIEYLIRKDTTGFHLYNYVDKPDLTMNEFVAYAKNYLDGKNSRNLRIPYSLGYLIGKCFDFKSRLTGKKSSISSVRVKKFCANTQFESLNIKKTSFEPPVPLSKGLEITLQSIIEEKNAK